MSLPFKIAIRFLNSNKGQTLLIIIGIAIGVSVQIFIGSLIQGLQKSLVDSTIGNSSQITVTSDNNISNYIKLTDDIKRVDSKIVNVSPTVDGSAFIFNNDNKSNPVIVRGFILDEGDKIYNIKNSLTKGSMPESANEVIVGKELSQELSLSINDSVILSTPLGNKYEVVISGIYDLKVSNINKSWVITNLSTSQNINDLNNQVTSIEIQVNSGDVFNTDIISEKIAKNISNEIEVQDWKKANEQLLSGLNGQSVSSIMIQVFVLISVVLGIASVLAISVVQKSRQIGILKAMGINNLSASQIFLFQGGILGFIGTFLGIILGLLLSFSFTKFAVNPDGSPIIDLYINYKFISISAVIAVAASVIASIIPARKSSKLNPIEVIKNG